MITVPRFGALSRIFDQYARVADQQIEPWYARTMRWTVDNASDQLDDVHRRLVSPRAVPSDPAAHAEMLRHVDTARTTLAQLTRELPSEIGPSPLHSPTLSGEFSSLADSIRAADAVVNARRGIGVPELPPAPALAVDDAARAAASLRDAQRFDALALTPEELRWVERPARAASVLRGVLGGRLAERALGVEVLGRGNVPRDGGVVIAATHTSRADQIYTLMGHDRAPRVMAHAEVIARQPLGGLVVALGGFPVTPHDAASGVRIMQGHLLKGRAVKIYPEGMQAGTDAVAPARKGAAIAAIATGKPVVVQGEYGTRPAAQYLDGAPRGKAISWSEPIQTSHLDVSNDEHVVALTGRISDELQRQRERARAAVDARR